MGLEWRVWGYRVGYEVGYGVRGFMNYWVAIVMLFFSLIPMNYIQVVQAARPGSGTLPPSPSSSSSPVSGHQQLYEEEMLLND